MGQPLEESRPRLPLSVRRTYTMRTMGARTGLRLAVAGLVSSVVASAEGAEGGSASASASVVASAIPERMVFTYKSNILESGKPKLYYDNVYATINAYRAQWGHPGDDGQGGGADVDFLDDAACRLAVEEVEPQLTPFFDSETRGDHKADICRIAALYKSGGYYFDMDLKTVNPVVPSAATTFATAEEPGGEGFFQAFLATVPNHPALKYCLDEMVTFYTDKQRAPMKTGGMGTVTLRRAYEKWLEEESESGTGEAGKGAEVAAEAAAEAEAESYQEKMRKVIGKDSTHFFVAEDEMLAKMQYELYQKQKPKKAPKELASEAGE